MDTKFASSLLSELMIEYNRVSLPCLGSFLGQHAPARLSEDGAMMLPPAKRINFHQNEIWNDEKLEKLIARRRKISLGKAKELVAFWIDDICLSLSTGNEVVLEGLGTFRVTADNKLVFEQQLTHNFLLESFGLEAVVLPVRQTAEDARSHLLRPSSDFVAKLKKRRTRRVFLKVVVALFFLKVAVVLVLVSVHIIPVPPQLIQYLPQFTVEKTEEQEEVSDLSTIQPVPAKPVGVFRIVMGIYPQYNEARAQVKLMEQSGFSPTIFYIPGTLPYQVYLGVYDTKTAGQVVLDHLIAKDSTYLFREAKVDLTPEEGELGL